MTASPKGAEGWGKKNSKLTITRGMHEIAQGGRNTNWVHICHYLLVCLLLLYFFSKVLMPLLILLFFSWLACYCISSSAFYNVPNER